METVVKEMIIIAGANGSGKTTFGLPYVDELQYRYLNADEIAKKLETEGEIDSIMIRAGRLFFQELENCLTHGDNFIVETTLSGSYVNKVSKRAKELGYNVTVIYIFLDSADLCVERVKTRVLKGGHNVPETDIRRRFTRSLNNFWNNFTEMASDWILLYNGESGFQPVAVGVEREFSIENEFLFKKFKQLINEANRTT